MKSSMGWKRDLRILVNLTTGQCSAFWIVHLLILQLISKNLYRTEMELQYFVENYSKSLCLDIKEKTWEEVQGIKIDGVGRRERLNLLPLIQLQGRVGLRLRKMCIARTSFDDAVEAWMMLHCGKERPQQLAQHELSKHLMRERKLERKILILIYTIFYLML